MEYKKKKWVTYLVESAHRTWELFLVDSILHQFQLIANRPYQIHNLTWYSWQVNQVRTYQAIIIAI